MTLFKIQRLQWHYSLFMPLLALWLPSSAQALTCKVDSFVSPNIGIITLDNANNASIEQPLTYSCTNTSDVTEWASVCIGVDGGDRSASQINPRYLFETSGSTLNFNMTLTGRSGATWGRRNVGGSEFIDFISVPPSSTIPTIKKTIIKVSLLSNNTSALAGDYTANFTGINTALTFTTVNSNVDNQQCLSGSQGSSQFSFTVQAKVVPQCIISATSDVDLGSQPASATNIPGNGNISVTCTNGAPYNIGLMPSNNNSDGSGFMRGTSGNNDQVPYQLQSNASGTIWGNNGSTYTTLTNGVIGQGNGAAQRETLYITVPKADFKPDNYSDTVTIRVNY